MRLLPLLALVAVHAALTACSGSGNGGDDDDLTDLDAVPVGALVVTEIQANPNTGRPEFIEVVNASSADVNLFGCVVADGGSTPHEHTIVVDVMLAPGELALLSSASDLGAEAGDVPVDVEWGELSLNQNDDLESVALRCPDGDGARHVVDEVVFDWGAADVTRGRSLQLTGTPDAAANDTLSAWCPAPAQVDTAYATIEGVVDYGTPGRATICETLDGVAPTAPGQLVIAEILIDDFSTTREWFELHNPGAEPLDLRGCRIVDGTPGDPDPTVHTLDRELGLTALPAGGQLLLAKGSLEVTPGDGEHPAVVADYPYASVGFNNSGSQRLAIECPAGVDFVVIDEIVYDWADYGSAFKGASLQLPPTALDAEANDDPANWCVSDTLFYRYTDDEARTFEARGTPGAPNPACPVPAPAPGAGQVVITELMIDPAGTASAGFREWFEVFNPGTDVLDLRGCTLEDGVVGEDPAATHVVDVSRGSTAVPPGGRLVLAKTEVGIAPADATYPAVDAGYAYGAVEFNNSGDQRLAIVCPGPVLVDEVTFNWTSFGAGHKGRSIQLAVGATSASANDSAANWCLGTQTFGAYTDGGGVTTNAQGSPGAANHACD